MLTKSITSLLIFLLLISHTLAGTGASHHQNNEEDDKRFQQRRQPSSSSQLSNADLVETVAAGVVIGGAIFAAYKMISPSSSSSEEKEPHLQAVPPKAYENSSSSSEEEPYLKTVSTRTSSNTQSLPLYRPMTTAGASRISTGDLSIYNDRPLEGRRVDHHSVYNNKPRKYLRAMSSEKEVPPLQTASGRASSNTQTLPLSSPVTTDRVPQKPTIDLSIYDDDIQLEGRRLDLHPVYNNNPRKHLREMIYEYQKEYHFSQIEDNMLRVITGTGKNRPGSNYRLRENVRQWLDEPYIQRRVERFWLADEGMFNVILRKNMKRIKS